MKKKIISILVILLVIGTFVANHIITYARVANPSLYVKIEELDLDGVGHGNGNPNPETGGNSNHGEYIWNLITQDTLTGPVSEVQKDLYCVKADYGQTWFTQENNQAILEYNLTYDMQSDRESLLAMLKDNGNDADDIIKELLNPEGNQYRQLLWIFDNGYVRDPNSNSQEKIDATVEKYLSQIGILKDEEEGRYYNQETNEWFGSKDAEPLTEADILAVQKMAIWYFTNGIEDTNYDKTEKQNWLYITTEAFGEYYTDLRSVSDSRSSMAMYLYQYLINGAKSGANQYTAENKYMLQPPSSVDTTNLEIKDNKYVIDTKRLDSNYLIGPIVINKNNDLGCDINIKVTDQNNKILNKTTNYIFADKDGNELKVDEKDLIGMTEGFYISVPRNLVESINITVEIFYNTTPKKLWLQGTEENDSVKLVAEQPLVELTEDPITLTVELTSKPQEFDLALRKYITAVNGTKVTDTRNPVIDESTLKTGTTATYKHRKNPVTVSDKDEVTYNITIYNEGNRAGYATKIIDQLPTGLVNSTNNKATVISKGKDGNLKNTYSVSYNTTTNQIVLTIVDSDENPAKSMQPYTLSNGLDYETIEIKCKVAQEADTKKQIILTNVAWIEGAYDSESQKEISNNGIIDRDSEPQTSPNVNKGNMENYKGDANNKEELADSNYYYQGEQDDDDFEKIVIMPVEKKFDLALFKHIAAISKDSKIENGEYVTDTGNIDGKYLRAPVVTAIDSETGKITYKQDQKTALTVEPGDYVLYTIRVYNEGEINGYASKIKDTLPIGLEFVIDNEEYNGIWQLEGLDTDGRQMVSTTWYAKGQGAELNSVEGDANYKANLLKALNKEAAISNKEPANPDFIDAQVLCKVVEKATSDRVLVNYAQIADDSDENGKPIDDIDSTPNEWKDGEDDQDIERIQLQFFDLSLRKFITSLNGVELKDKNGKYEREPVVDLSKLINKTDTTATYIHSKKPLNVQIGDRVVYTIRVYNEGDINGYASEIKDYLPPYLTYAQNSEINTKYKWQLSKDGRVVVSTYLEDKELKAFNGKTLDYEDVQIECIVSNSAPVKQSQTNIAEITEYKYNGGTSYRDRDSISDNMESKIPDDKELPQYKDEQINKSYVPGNEDDDDFEKIYVREFDLALKKFITKVQDKDIISRVPQVKIENETISYETLKDAINVHVGDVITYTIRVYNEGEIDGYATEITDDIPEYLEYLPENSINIDYMWKMYDDNGNETENVKDAVKVKTNYLSKENGEDNLIKAFDGKILSYKDVKIAFKINDPNSNTHIITNHAQISDDSDEKGNEIKDKDSEPDKWNDGEDDQDIENVKVEYFDLSLLKFVKKVIIIENGKETITETGYNGSENPEPVVKVEIHKKKLNNVVVKFVYGITITNEGDIPGYATEITDYVPDGLKFEASDNPEWVDEGNNVISTKQLENTLLQPGESKTVDVTFTWINGKDNLSLKTNIAEISEDKNEYNVPDRDSTPDNKQDGEDDKDIAKVVLAVTTGAGQTYFMLTLGLLAVIAIGVILIKKFVI